MVSQAGLNLWYGYLKITGSTGALARNAPVLKGRMKSPFVVVPSMETRSNYTTKTAALGKVCERYMDLIKAATTEFQSMIKTAKKEFYPLL